MIKNAILAYRIGFAMGFKVPTTREAALRAQLKNPTLWRFYRKGFKDCRQLIREIMIEKSIETWEI